MVKTKINKSKQRKNNTLKRKKTKINHRKNINNFKKKIIGGNDNENDNDNDVPLINVNVNPTYEPTFIYNGTRDINGNNINYYYNLTYTECKRVFTSIPPLSKKVETFRKMFKNICRCQSWFCLGPPFFFEFVLIKMKLELQEKENIETELKTNLWPLLNKSLFIPDNIESLTEYFPKKLYWGFNDKRTSECSLQLADIDISAKTYPEIPSQYYYYADMLNWLARIFLSKNIPTMAFTFRLPEDTTKKVLEKKGNIFFGSEIRKIFGEELYGIVLESIKKCCEQNTSFGITNKLRSNLNQLGVGVGDS